VSLQVAAIVAMVALLGALLIFAAPSAHANSVSNGKCADNTGLNVVVDFFDGRAPLVKCVENWSGGTGLNGFQAAGLKVQGVGGSLAFICRINDFPKDELCNTYPDDGYWSYWTATAGSWTYSDLGVTEKHVAAGHWQGFSYSSVNNAQKNNLPRISPKVPSAPKPKPKPSPKPTSTSKPKPTSKPSASSKPKSSSSGTSSSKPESSSASTKSPSPSGSKTSAPGSSDSTPSPSDSAAPDPDAKEDSAATTDPADDAQASESTDPDAEETGAAAETDSGANDADTSANVQDSSAQHTRSENADPSPPVGTLIVGGVIVLLVGAGIFRHRTGKKLEGN